MSAARCGHPRPLRNATWLAQHQVDWRDLLIVLAVVALRPVQLSGPEGPYLALEARPWLDTLDSHMLQQPYTRKDGKPGGRLVGNLLQRVVYHYW